MCATFNCCKGGDWCEALTSGDAAFIPGTWYVGVTAGSGKPSKYGGARLADK